MTRIACIGNSHLAAFKMAETTIKTRYPELELHFFGLPNPLFFQGTSLGGSALRVAEAVDVHPSQVIDPEGAVALDLSSYDLVLLASHGFYLRSLWRVLGGFNVLGLAPLDPDRAWLSQPCLSAAIATPARAYAQRLAAFFPALDQMLVVQTPFPSLQAVSFNADLADLAAQPDRQVIFDLYQRTLGEIVGEEGLALYPVPEPLMAAPFFCKPHYARAAELPPDQAPILSDLAHMNAGFASDLFDHIYRDLIAP